MDWEMSHMFWEAHVTASACEIADCLKLLAPPMEGENIKSRIARAARDAGLSYWRAWDIWYGKARRIDAHEADAIRAARAKRAERKANELTAIASDFEALAERLASLAAQGNRDEVNRARLLSERVRRLAAGE
jgi:hypothetical protein